MQRVLEPALLGALRDRRDGLLEEARQALRDAGDAPGAAGTARVSLELRPQSGERGLEVPWTDAAEISAGESIATLRSAFESRHLSRFGYVVADEALVVERLQVLLPAAAGPRLRPTPGDPEEGLGCGESRTEPEGPAQPCGRVPLCLPAAGAEGAAGDLTWVQVPCWRREALRAGQSLVGPAVVLEATGTTVLEPGWGGRMLPDGALLLEPLAPQEPGRPMPEPTCGSAVPPDPVRLELYNHRFSAIAEQMGVRLQQSSRSVNIRERLDFSCALFDAAGRLVANAPHIPVHLEIGRAHV